MIDFIWKLIKLFSGYIWSYTLFLSLRLSISKKVFKSKIINPKILDKEFYEKDLEKGWENFIQIS